jgi:hypothetical protein
MWKMENGRRRKRPTEGRQRFLLTLFFHIMDSQRERLLRVWRTKQTLWQHSGIYGISLLVNINRDRILSENKSLPHSHPIKATRNK